MASPLLYAYLVYLGFLSLNFYWVTSKFYAHLYEASTFTIKRNNLKKYPKESLEMFKKNIKKIFLTQVYIFLSALIFF